MFLEVVLTVLLIMSSKVPFDSFLDNFGDSVVFLPVLGVSVLAYPGDVVTHEVWPRSLVRNEFLSWWRPGLSVSGLTHCGRGLTARQCTFLAALMGVLWRRSRQCPQGCFQR